MLTNMNLIGRVVASAALLLGGVTYAQPSPASIPPIVTSFVQNDRCELAIASNTDRSYAYAITVYYEIMVDTPAGRVTWDFPAGNWGNLSSNTTQLHRPSYHTLLMRPGETKVLGCKTAFLANAYRFFTHAVVGVVKVDSPESWRDLDHPEKYLGLMQSDTLLPGNTCLVPHSQQTFSSMMSNSHPSRTIVVRLKLTEGPNSGKEYYMHLVPTTIGGGSFNICSSDSPHLHIVDARFVD